MIENNWGDHFQDRNIFSDFYFTENWWTYNYQNIIFYIIFHWLSCFYKSCLKKYIKNVFTPYLNEIFKLFARPTLVWNKIYVNFFWKKYNICIYKIFIWPRFIMRKIKKIWGTKNECKLLYIFWDRECG